MSPKALLIIGEDQIAENRPYVSFGRFVKYARRLQKKGLELNIINYNQLLAGQVPRFTAARIRVVLFFPYQYWNHQIEIYPDDRVYGDLRFGQEFKVFFRRVRRALERYYPGKKIKYLNPPQACYLDRDKQATKDLLTKHAVPTPRSFKVSSLQDIQRLLDRGISLFLKPRFGSMGKGITYIDRENVISNFLFRKGRLISRQTDFNWRFNKIKDRENFLSRLLQRGFICEQAIPLPTFKGRRFDFRVYVMFGKVVYLYAKSSEEMVTNWSQGGRIDKRRAILKAFPKSKVNLAKKLARQATQSMGLNFAGIDVIFSQDLKSAYVLEGNAFPGFEKGFDLMKCLASSLTK
ncbi:RimK family alpha-L-glutamate ligase [Candidatus Omnitrophota bacterium]